MTKKWYETSYRRFFLDFHIDDWNEEFLSRFDPEEYARCVELGGGTAATVFANTHTGLCNYPTKVGAMHKNLKGRDLLKEMIDSLRKRNISPVIYYCTVYVNHYWEEHPEARIVDAAGESKKLKINCVGNPERFAVCCPNNEKYRKFIVDQLVEICTNYDFDGVWPDMTFWPTVCYCENCREKYRREMGLEIPREIHWADPEWVQFQRTRQRWLVELWKLVTSTIRKYKPGASVAHQSQTFIWDWLAGGSGELAEETDWLSADLYGERYALSYSAKIFYSFSKNKPFERINCWNVPNIHEHILTRTRDEMRSITYSTFMNHGAMVIIDQVDPVGTIHKHNYEMLGSIFNELKPYEKYSGGEFCQDVGIYYSLNSNYDNAYSGKPVLPEYVFAPGRKEQSPEAHVHSAFSASKTLIMNHVPYGVVTKRNLGDLGKYQVIVLSNVLTLDSEEIKAIKEYVSGGGCLLASKYTSVIGEEGKWTEDFALSKLFGVSYRGETQEKMTYVSPVKEYEHLFPGFTSEFPVTVADNQVIIEVNNPAAKVIATVTLPYDYPAEDRHGSMLTDPPGRYTEYPAVVMNTYGKGKVIYTSGVLETGTHDSQRLVYLSLIKQLFTRPLYITTNAHRAVEITRFDQKDKNRTILHVLSFQQEFPNIPIYNMKVNVWAKGKTIESVSKLPGGEELSFSEMGDYVELILPKIENFCMIEIRYGKAGELCY